MITLNIKGMHCKSCVALVTEALEEIGASAIKIRLDEKKQEAALTCNYKGNTKDLIKTIEKEGYTVEQ